MSVGWGGEIEELAVAMSRSNGKAAKMGKEGKTKKELSCMCRW